MKRIISVLLVAILTMSGFITNASAATIKLNKSKKTIYVGDTLKLKLKNAPSVAKITWKSSDESIATVNDSGKVTAVKKGKTTITATYKKKDYKCKVTVKKQKQSDSTGFSKAKQGDIITFGSYEQDNNLDNGKEPIEWIVLSNNDSVLFVVSKYALDSKPYNKESIDVTWETCTLRKWLNEDFYKTAFSKTEQSVIKLITLENMNNPEYGTEGGNDTKDKVFLLSIADMINTEYGFIDKNYDLNVDNMTNRRCAPTAYAVAQGTRTGTRYKTAEGDAACYWWLRSPGYYIRSAAFLYSNGYVHASGDSVYLDYIGVRPAIVISLE